MMSEQELSASQEDYIEAIYFIVERKQAARAKDIAEHLGVTGASVTGALHALAKKGLVNHEPYDIVTLTDKGRRAARNVVRRHRGLKDFLVKVLAVDEAEAEACACRMEHAVPQDVLNRIVEFVGFTQSSPLYAVQWDDKQECFSIASEDADG